jgi:hypothetical protein
MEVVLSAFEQGAQCSTHSFGRQRSIPRIFTYVLPPVVVRQIFLDFPYHDIFRTREPASHLHKGQESRKPHRSRTGKQVFDIDLFPHHLNGDPYASRMILLALFSLSTPRTGSNLVPSPTKVTSYLPRLSRVPLPNPCSDGQEVGSCPETEESLVPQDFQLVRWREFTLPQYPHPSRSLFLELHSAAVRIF